MRTVVLGIGNTLLADDGFGPRVVELLQDHALPEGVRAMDAGTAVMNVLAEVAGVDLLVVVDAVASGRPPGNLLRIEGEDVPRFFAQGLSPHQDGLPDLLATLSLTGELPQRIILIGVEPASLETGCGLTETVERRLPAALAMVREALRRCVGPT